VTRTAAGPALRTFSLLKQVPGLDHEADLDADRRLVRDPGQTDINPWCRRALAYAIELAGEGGCCTAVTMGPPSARTALREAQACGADRLVHLCDPGLAGSDCLRTARALSALLAHLTGDRLGARDLVLVGRSTVDGGTSAVGMMVAEYLGIPFVGTALRLAVEDTTSWPRGHALLQNEGATETVEFTLPAVVAVAERSILPARSPRETWPDGSRIATFGLTDLAGRFDASAASPTRVVGVRPVPRGDRAARVLHADWLASLLDVVDGVKTAAPPDAMRAPARQAGTPPPSRSGRRILLVSSGQDSAGLRALVGEGRRLAALVGAEVVAVGPPQPADEPPDGWSGVDGRVVVADTEPMAAAESIAAWLREDPAWAVLGTPIAWDREVLSRLAVRLDAGLLSDLTAVSVVNGREIPRLIGEKPAGIASLAEVDTVAPTQVMTLRTGALGGDEPPRGLAPPWTLHLPGRGGGFITRSGRMVANSYEALDRARVVIGVGQGIEPADYPYLERLRAALGAEFAATRKVTDRAWMDHDRQVGVTARDIAPDLYLALALSGNQNHLAGVAGAGMIVAVNNDPLAAIFAGCDLGIVADWRAVAAGLIDHRDR
jgi:electron transfer flavoprotein alpha subunit/electron transfer flavoprotein alpha/beta subunit